MLGEAYRRRGELRLASQALQKARRHETCRNRAELKLARIHEEQGQSPQSRRLLPGTVLRIEATDGKELGLAAMALQHLQQYRESNHYFRRATRAEPDDLHTQVAWGNLFLEKYDPANASTSFKAALKINPIFRKPCWHGAHPHPGILRAGGSPAEEGLEKSIPT